MQERYRRLKRTIIGLLMSIVLIFGPTAPGAYEHLPKLISGMLVWLGLALVGWVLADLITLIFKRR